jgi:hypothetical protein
MPILQNVIVEDADLPPIMPYTVDGQGQASGSSPVFTPMDLPGLFMWVRADQGISLSGSLVTGWADQSGTGNSPVGAASHQPTYVASSPLYNNQPAIFFVNASSTHMNIASVAGCTGQPMTSIIVGNSTNSATEGTFQNGTSVTCSAGFFDDASGNIYMSAGTQVDTLVSGLNPCIMALIANGANCKGYVNNSQTPVSSWNGGTGSFNGQGMQIGTGGVAPLDGYIAEMICCNGALTPQQMHLVFAYLANRYGIPGVI